ncbi:hypothetical protein [Pontibacter anaerobius]|uniref:Uncharacterized protein n=1 Tax=Pontibacter anaerobius TaxID=2993940 RepID=A0ABT3RCQ9_9BACT|nr:hypothetical protein [Pontibacter anaerobius]MCX2739317.1 hypothetical protein [Pontibacter anaerobius]
MAIYQILGGLLGLVLTILVMLNGDITVTQQVLRMGVFAGLLYVFSILCGRVLFRNRKRGLRLSLVNQVLQVLYFSFGSISFQYVAGLRVGIGMDLVGSWIFKFRIALSSFHFSIETDLGQKYIGINLVALFLIFWIERLQEKQPAT